MRKNVVVLFLVVTFVAAGSVVAGTAKAAFIDNGNNLIYDSTQNVTWYDPVPTAMTWSQANAWAAGLTVGGTATGSWSLPTTPGITLGYTSEGEMGQLYVELGNTVGVTLTNTGFFANLQSSSYYWSGTVYAKNQNNAWTYYFLNGDQSQNTKTKDYYALAVCSGDVGAPVPIPGAILLFAPGLAGIVALKRRKGRRGDRPARDIILPHGFL